MCDWSFVVDADHAAEDRPKAGSFEKWRSLCGRGLCYVPCRRPHAAWTVQCDEKHSGHWAGFLFCNRSVRSAGRTAGNQRLFLVRQVVCIGHSATIYFKGLSKSPRGSCLARCRFFVRSTRDPGGAALHRRALPCCADTDVTKRLPISCQSASALVL